MSYSKTNYPADHYALYFWGHGWSWHPGWVMEDDTSAISSSASTVSDKTWSALAVDARMNTLTTAVDQWAAALTTGLGANKKAYSTAFGAAKSYWQAPMDKDLYDLAAKVNAKVTDATIRARGTAVMNAFPSVVLHERHVSQYAGSHGITIYGPAAKNQRIDFPYYRTLDLSVHTRWDDFINAFVP